MGLSRRMGTPLFDRSAEAPTSIALQPVPLRTRVVCLRTTGGVVTAVYRDWKPGDSGAGGRCRLCERCDAHHDGCLVVIGREVAADEAPLLSRVGTHSQT